jgi:hypothetical protein
VRHLQIQKSCCLSIPCINSGRCSVMIHLQCMYLGRCRGKLLTLVLRA